MSHTILGKKVGPIGYGLMGLTLSGSVPDEKAIAAIKTAIDSGCNYLNGGEFYGPPNANSLALLRKYFEKYPEDAKKVVLNVKGAMSPQRTPDASKEGIIRSIDNCLNTLGPVGRIDQFEPARKDKNVPFEETLETIDGYVKSGKIGGISVSELGAETLRKAASQFNITSLEIELSLFRTEPITNGLLAACAELNIPVLAYSPLCRGFLGGQLKSPDDLPENDFRRMLPRYQGENFKKNIELVNKVEALAKKKGCTTGQIAINWLLSISKRPGMPVIIPIPGSSNPERIKENATIIDLSPADIAEIDAILETFVAAGDRYPQMLMGDLDL
ncbi:unnamed protein product [Clonostachys rhizophaga]|uniref:NADP-dependent oxidoreductase domain-containing protein n=1 Tax=Clonostachys rhizophaga TaxID=160324 RepID=A0A9N9V5J7_9HYPO|nr:unnamed protein product [Clonostachys rhizophaga]